MKKVAALLLLALATVALVACGSSNSSSESTAATTESSAESGGGSEGTGGSGGSGGESVVKIEAAQGSTLAYAQKEVKAKAGQVSIEFTNPQSLSHDVAVESSSGEEVGATELVASGKAVTTISNLKPGKYTFYCTVPGHREAGMEGTLTVE
jgi:plastocyanin